jgi:predicted phosphodiesterase
MVSMKLVVTSDLHYDTRGDLTEPAAIERLAEEIRAEAPDALVLAGDLGHRIAEFRACLTCFAGVCASTGVVAGNHDVWRDDQAGHGSQALFEELLPAVARDLGYTWLEDDVIRVGDRAVAGSCAWYDYSGVDPRHVGGYSPDDLQLIKGTMSNDAGWIDWPWTDRELAARVRAGLAARLDALEGDAGVEAVAVVTHVPILDAQMTRKADDERWGISNAYFGNLTIGRDVLARAKVRAVVSGHTHHGREARVDRADMPPVEVRVVDADYGEPRFTVLEV